MYNSQFELGHVALNVRNLELQSLFYQQVLGLQILTESQNQIDLGVGQTILVRLIQTSQDGDAGQSYGLYHLAIVLPSREDLGTIFRHFIDNKVPLQGTSDLPQDSWDVRPDGRIVGITEPMDAEEIYALGKKADAVYQMPLGSRMGHIHLSVRESSASSRFYQEVLAVEDKFSVPSAAWLASGDYHHHLAVNEWGGKHLQTRTEGMPGLAYYTVIYSSPLAFEATLERATAANLNVYKHDNNAVFVDADGIKTKLCIID
ncbi:TPA: VOC family protein [Streptococcus suis]